MFVQERDKMTIKEFKKMLKKDGHPVTKETGWMLLITIIYIMGLGSLLYMQFNNLIPSVVSLVFIGVLILIAIPAMIIDLKRDRKIKAMHLYYLRENKLPEEKDDVKTLKMIFLSLVVAIILIGTFISFKYLINIDKKIVNNNEKKEAFEVKKQDGEVIKTEFYTFDNDNFYLKIPKEFDSMSSDLINVKYPKGNVPTYVLTNEETTINVVVNVTKDNIKNESITPFLETMRQTLATSNEIIETNVYKKQNHNIGEIKFISKASDTDIYNHMIIFSVDATLRIVSFNCTKDLMENWKSVGEFIIGSLSFN